MEVPPSSTRGTGYPNGQPDTRRRETIPQTAYSIVRADVPDHVVDDDIVRTLQPKPRRYKLTTWGNHPHSEPPSLVDIAHKREDRGKPRASPPPTGSRRKNPANSLYWRTLTEVDMLKPGKRQDKSYYACTLQVVRKKKQQIRHDVEEIQRWPDTRCRHAHDPQECRPQRREDSTSTSQTSQGRPWQRPR